MKGSMLMASILMINIPYSGHTNPTLPLASELVKRGYKVLYINAEEFREKIEATPATPQYIHTKWGVGYYFHE